MPIINSWQQQKSLKCSSVHTQCSYFQQLCLLQRELITTRMAPLATIIFTRVLSFWLQQSVTANLFQTVLCYSELTKQLCVKRSEPKLEVLYKQPLPFLTDLLICWVLKFQETALITLVITSHTVFWSSLYTYNYKQKRSVGIWNTCSIPTLSCKSFRGKEVTMATSCRLGHSDWTLGKMSLPEHSGPGCPVPGRRMPGTWKPVFLLITLFYTPLKVTPFWTDPLEKQKVLAAATSIPTLLLYIQYIQYCTFHVKCPFIDLTFLQPAPNTSTSSATNAR